MSSVKRRPRCLGLNVLKLERTEDTPWLVTVGGLWWLCHVVILAKDIEEYLYMSNNKWNYICDWMDGILLLFIPCHKGHLLERTSFLDKKIPFLQLVHHHYSLRNSQSLIQADLEKLCFNNTSVMVQPSSNEYLLLLRKIYTKMYNCHSIANVNAGRHFADDIFKIIFFYMRQWIGSALVQIMACRLFGTKQLSKPMLGYCQLDY